MIWILTGLAFAIAPAGMAAASDTQTVALSRDSGRVAAADSVAYAGLPRRSLARAGFDAIGPASSPGVSSNAISSQ
jgi:hypothetical protein